MKLNRTVLVIGCLFSILASSLFSSAQDAFEPDNLPSNARPISSGTPQNHSISPAGDYDWAVFTLTAVRDVKLETRDTASDTVMWLYSGAGAQTLVAYNDDSGGSLLSTISQRLNPGTYYVKVGEYGNDGTIPSYSLKLSIDTTILPDQYEADDTDSWGKSILSGESQRRTLHQEVDQDYVVFTLTRDSSVVITANQTDTNPFGGGITPILGVGSDITVRLFGPNDPYRYIEGNDDDNYPFSRSASIKRTRLGPGRYYILTADLRRNMFWAPLPAVSGKTVLFGPFQPYAYTLSLNVGEPGDAFEPDDSSSQASTITPTVPQSHSFHTAGDRDWVKFTLSQASDVRIETDGLAGDTEMWLYGPNDPTRLIEYNDDSGNGTFSLISRTGINRLSAGTYFIKLSEYGNNDRIAAFSLNLSTRAYVLPPILKEPSVGSVDKKVAVILARFSDLPNVTPRDRSFYESYFTEAGAGSGGAYDYWRDVTFGTFALDGSQVFGWMSLNHTKAEADRLIYPGGRGTVAQWGIDAARANGIDLSPFKAVIVVVNASNDHGAAGGNTMVLGYNPMVWEPTFIFHEMGHCYGLPHSYAANPDQVYGDPWDIMSAMNVQSYRGGDGYPIGPALNVPNLQRLGALPSSRVWRNTPGRPFPGQFVRLAPLSAHWNAGYLAIEISPVPCAGNTRYWVEYRRPERWDAGFDRDAVIVHEVRADGLSYLHRQRLLNVGDTERCNDGFVDVTLSSFDPATGSAIVEVKYNGSGCL